MSWIDRSGTITAGATAQTIMAANPRRRGFMIQNVSDTDMWFDMGVTAVAAAPSVRVVAGGLYETPPNAQPTGHVSLICAAIAKAFTAKEWEG